MKARNVNVKLSVLSMAMLGVFSSMYSYADDEEAAALMNPTSSVTVEEIYVSQGSQKFGEYNGLNKQGGYLNGNINIRGGDAYRGNQNGGTARWLIQGTDLGLSDRSANIGYADQGAWGVNVGYDELTHNLAPGYQTPYNGSMGGNSFILPNSVGGKTVPFAIPASGTAGGTQELTGAGFNNMDVSTTRKNTSLNAIAVINSNTNITFDFNHLDQSGAKLMAFASSQWTVPLVPVTTGGVTKLTASVYGQGVSILPNPTNYQTDTVNLAANWRGESGHLSASYFGSFFRDGYSGVQFQTFGVTGSSGTSSTATGLNTMGTAPSNTLHQLNLSGGYDLASKTKLNGNLSVSRNTQNSSTSVDTFQMGAAYPTSAFNGLVNTTHADIKVSDRSFQDLTLSAGYKFDGRDNLSQSNMQSFNSISSAGAYYPNTPLSYKNSIFEVAGEYKLTEGQKTSLTYQNKYLNQYCNQYAVGSTATVVATATNGSLDANNYPAGANCVTTPSSISNNITALYKNRVSEDVNFRVSYGYDVRSSTNSTTAIASFKDPSVATISGAGAATALPGTNANNYSGFQPFFEASRVQQVVKGVVNWQAAENLSFGLGGKYAYDNYTASTYGVQNANLWSVNLDAAYQYAEKASLTAFATQQSGMRNLLNYYNSASSSTGAGAGTWNNNLTTTDTTLGLSLKHAGLLQDKLTLLADATYSLGQSSYSTTTNYAYTNGVCAVGSSVTSGATYNYANCGTLPTIANRMAALKLGGFYQIDKHQGVGIRYMYQHLNSSDYYYNGYQAGYTPVNVLPTNQTSGSYNVYVIAASYTYTFN